MKIKDIANLAGVSIATVSKIINNKDNSINPKTREKVLEIVKKYNYTPYSAVKQSQDKHSFTLAVIFKGKEFNNTILTRIIETAQNKNYSVAVYLSENSIEKELQHITSIVKNNIDGVIWEYVSEESLINKKYFDENNTKYLYLNSQEQGFFIDYPKGIYSAGEELIKRGHKEILLFGFDHEAERKSFEKSFFEKNINFNKKNIINSCRELEDILNENRITGIITKNISQARFIKNKLNSIKYKVPEDISIITFENDLNCSDFSFLQKEEKKLGEIITENLISLCEKREYKKFFNQEFLLNNESTIKVLDRKAEKKVVVIGSINTDITLNVNEFPGEENTIIIHKHDFSVGGKGVNQSLGIKKMGVPVSLIGKIGNDLEGKNIISKLTFEGLDIDGVSKDNNSETGKAYIYLKKDGKSTVSIFPGANDKLSPEDIEKQKNLFKNSSYCLISTEIPENSIKKAVEIAKNNSAKIILKPSSREKIDDDILKEIDIFILNKTEFEILYKQGKSTEERAEYFLKKGVKNIILTSKKDGYTLINKNIQKKFPPVDFPSIDTTGSSDIFIATFTSYLIKDFSMEAAIEIAGYASAFSTLSQGASNGLIDKISLESYIAQKKPSLLQI